MKGTCELFGNHEKYPSMNYRNSRMRRIFPAKIWKIYSVKNRRKFPQTMERDIPPDKRHTITSNRKGQTSHFPVHWPFLRITGLFLPEPQKEVLVPCTWTCSLKDLVLPKSRTGNKDTQNQFLTCGRIALQHYISVPHMSLFGKDHSWRFPVVPRFFPCGVSWMNSREAWT